MTNQRLNAHEFMMMAFVGLMGAAALIVMLTHVIITLKKEFPGLFWGGIVFYSALVGIAIIQSINDRRQQKAVRPSQ